MKHSTRLSFALRLLLGVMLVLPILSTSRVARAAGDFVVNSSADTNTRDGVLTLREALLVANGHLSGPFTAAERTQLGGCTFDGSGYITGGCGLGISDSITFHSSVTQVNLTDPLPSLTDAGTSINGNAGVPRIDASGLTVASDVFVISLNDITISNLSIVNGYSFGSVADIAVNGGKNVRIADNFLGTVPGATNCSPSGVTRNSDSGVVVWVNGSGSSGANNGVAYIYGNTLGCHNGYGVYVYGADFAYIGVEPDGTTAAGNYIGTNTSKSNLGNGSDGVCLQGYSSDDGVRWSVVANNTIRNNHENGIQLIGTGTNNSDSTTNNSIKNNSIYGNTRSGIRLTTSAYSNFIGGSGGMDRNLIGLNGDDGITILNSNNNWIQGNFIGTFGGTDEGNSKAGVYLGSANDTTITGNVISANDWAGVWAYNSNGTTINNNKIGTNDTGTAALANGHDGIALTDGSQNSTIGGTTLADRNIISGNT